VARNGAGTYNLPAGQPVVTGTVISSTTFNTLTSDIATALTASIANDGQTVPVANLPMGGFKLTGLGDATVANDAIRYNGALGTPSSGTVTNLTGTASININGTVGSTTPTTGKFTTVTATGGINEARGSIAMHATTMDLWAQPNIIDGTSSAVTITAIANAPQAGARRVLYPVAASVITNGATFAVDGAANATAAAGDRWEFEAITTSTYKVHITKADGTAVASGASSGFATGMGMALHTATVPSGWILADGRTIGDASSGATNRANADCQALFTEFWNSYANAELAVSGGRGANAAADWAAHKTIGVPDLRGRTIVGKDNMGGTTASRITSGGSGITGTTLGASGGTETHTLTTAQLASHQHTINVRGSGTGALTSINSTNATDGDNLGGASSTANAGSGSAHQNTQPSIVCNYIIKL